MTKLKSLVTVTVENVFRSFPIDSERYELVAAVGTMKEVFFEEDVLSTDLVGDERMKAFLYGVIENFGLGATSMLQTYAIGSYPTTIPQIVFDRARRAAASMNQFDAEYQWEKTPRENVRMWMWCLWSNFDQALQEAHDHKPQNDLDERAWRMLRAFYLGRHAALQSKSLEDMELQS
jgi:hypothetical protein